MIKRKTIFQQLIYSIIVPVVSALVVLGVLNYIQTRNHILESNKKINQLITEEIMHIYKFQNIAFSTLENEINPVLRRNSENLINDHFRSTENIQNIDLNELCLKTGSNLKFEEINIISKSGIIVNSTDKNKRGLDLFQNGTKYKSLIKNALEGKLFIDEFFAFDEPSKRLKKYIYQQTPDGKYLIEQVFYSPEAESLIQIFNNSINELNDREKSIKSIDIFIGRDTPISINKDVKIDSAHLETYHRVVSTGQKQDIVEISDKRPFHYEYIYIPDRISESLGGAVIRIISDHSNDRVILRRELFKFFVIFGLAVLITIFLIYRKMREITDPVRDLLERVNRIADGHLDERAEIVGNNEITSLSEQFNFMIAQLESYYNELEEKVRQRTAEIIAQKKEIEAQRDSIHEQRNILVEINNSLQKAYLELDEKKKHIEDSIHYAKRIQNAILPPDDYIKRLLKDSFVLYKPKDIVSGDFYWMVNKDNKAIVAAVDCTGHGVPGAFMSFVGNNQLNYIVNVLGKLRPDEILNALNENVTRTLRQTRISSSIKDGMDIALISIDFENRKLQYAGAYSPLFYIRDDKINHLLPDKFPVGGYMGEVLRNFTLKEMEIKEGDLLYIFSDGFPDQFGGPNDSKFLIKRFRELLLQISKEPMEEQKEILNQIHLDWKGDRPQVDDILIIGIKI